MFLKKGKSFFWISAITLVFTISCGKKYTPKPHAYHRIDFPEKKYTPIQNKYPFSFEIPQYMLIEKDNFVVSKEHWINLRIPSLKAKIHISYYPIEKNLNEFSEDAHQLAYKHTIRADAINSREFVDSNRQVYALLYILEGNVASFVQFTVTDNKKHFLRGALYFNLTTKKDSIEPVVAFIKKDIIHLIETFKWK